MIQDFARKLQAACADQWPDRMMRNDLGQMAWELVADPPEGIRHVVTATYEDDVHLVEFIGAEEKFGAESRYLALAVMVAALGAAGHENALEFREELQGILETEP